MFFVYILQSINTKRYYIGSCECLEKRLSQHNKGGVKSTKPYLPWQLVHRETHNTLKEARRRELEIKSWKKRAMIEKTVKHFKI